MNGQACRPICKRGDSVARFPEKDGFFEKVWRIAVASGYACYEADKPFALVHHLVHYWTRGPRSLSRVMVRWWYCRACRRRVRCLQRRLGSGRLPLSCRSSRVRIVTTPLGWLPSQTRTSQTPSASLPTSKRPQPGRRGGAPSFPATSSRCRLEPPSSGRWRRVGLSF